MVSARKHHTLKPSKPITPAPPLLPPLQNPKSPIFNSDADTKTPLLLPTLLNQSSPSKTPFTIDDTDQDSMLRQSGSLTREEVLLRRSRRVKQLANYYKNQYWALMDEIRTKYREYYWRYGKSPFKEGGDASVSAAVEGSGENNSDSRINCGNGSDSEKKCAFGGCKSKPMALTSYCHSHILSDSKQKLYKPCSYVVKSGAGTCGKPVLRAAVPSLCAVHFQKAQRHVSQALKNAGLNIPSSSKPVSKFPVIIAEYVHQIQSKRIEARNTMVVSDEVKEENAG